MGFSLVIIHNFPGKVCEICGGKKACGLKGEGVIINTGDNSPAIRPEKGQNQFVKRTERRR